MGVDFFSCHYCGESICDAYDYVRCGCHKGWCEYTDYAEKEGYDRNTDTCSFCRMENVEDSSLVVFLLKQLGWTRKEAVLYYYGDYPDDDNSSSSS